MPQPTNGHYSREEEAEDDPGNALDNWNAHSAALTGFVPETARLLDETQEALGKVYENAGSDADRERLIKAWEHAQAMANQVVQLDAGRQAADAVLKLIASEQRRIVRELEQLEVAIEEMDTTDWRVRAVYNEAYDQAAENLTDEIMDEAGFRAIETVEEDLRDGIRTLTGDCPWPVAIAIINAFLGNPEQLTEAETAQLVALVEMVKARKAAEAAPA